MAKQKQTKKEMARKASKPAPVEQKVAASGWRRSGFKCSSTARRLKAEGKTR